MEDATREIRKKTRYKKYAKMWNITGTGPTGTQSDLELGRKRNGTRPYAMTAVSVLGSNDLGSDYCAYVSHWVKRRWFLPCYRSETIELKKRSLEKDVVIDTDVYETVHVFLRSTVAMELRVFDNGRFVIEL